MKVFFASIFTAVFAVALAVASFVFLFGGGIGVFNAKNTVQKCLAGVAAHQELVNRFGATERDLNIQIDALKKDVEQFSKQVARMSPERADAKRAEFAARDRALGERRTELLHAANAIKNATDKQIASLLTKASERVAKKKFLGAIIEISRAGATFARIDVTKDLIRVMNEEWIASGGRFVDLPNMPLANPQTRNHSESQDRSSNEVSYSVRSQDQRSQPKVTKLRR